ncbi:hypothetical protein [Geomonas subterranea]|uniref:hypothetical protein n=1 Tax=Geomonas subterranea TaxID=2847989 RepID=UPI001CD6DDD1|nr:hypothetical protein [Geomonas fuzhouensis]
MFYDLVACNYFKLQTKKEKCTVNYFLLLLGVVAERGVFAFFVHPFWRLLKRCRINVSDNPLNQSCRPPGSLAHYPAAKLLLLAGACKPMIGFQMTR